KNPTRSPILGSVRCRGRNFHPELQMVLGRAGGSMGTHCRNELMASSSPPPCSWRLRLPLWCSSVVALSLPRHPPTAQGGASFWVPSSKPGLTSRFAVAANPAGASRNNNRDDCQQVKGVFSEGFI